MKKFISITGAILIAASAFSITALGASPNYYSNTEEFQLYYKGYIQVQGSYNDGGYNYISGYIRYSGGASGDTGRLYTQGTPTGPKDNAIYSRSHTYRDTLNPWAPQTKFNYGFSKIPVGSAWPLPSLAANNDNQTTTIIHEDYEIPASSR